MKEKINNIRKDIINHPENKWASDLGYEPVFTAGVDSKIVIIGQAPGIKAQESKISWNDLSGIRLRKWMGVPDEIFYNKEMISLIPMDFYFPGEGKNGDLPPRKGFADTWHPRLFSLLPNIKLIVLVGQYSIKHYLGNDTKKTLKETVQNYKNYLPKFFTLPHPSPRNMHWFQKNPWLEAQVIPDLKAIVSETIKV